LGAEIEREVARLALVVTQIKAIETQQPESVKAGTQPAIALLARLGGTALRQSGRRTRQPITPICRRDASIAGKMACCKRIRRRASS
jgi:hypothetical protein